MFDGNIASLDPGYSIGGPSALNQQILGGGGILGTPQGLSGSHNKYESDASSGRYDLYTGGNDYKVDLVRYRALYDLGEPYDLDTFKVHRKNMFLKSVNEVRSELSWVPTSQLLQSVLSRCVTSVVSALNATWNVRCHFLRGFADKSRAEPILFQRTLRRCHR